MRECCCLVCGKPVQGTAWVHRECLRGPGWDLTGSQRNWPAWAKALKRDEERHRRNEPCGETIGLDAIAERENGDS